MQPAPWGARHRRRGLLLLLVLLPVVCPAQGPVEVDPSKFIQPLTPAESMRLIQVPRGYHLEIVATEPMVQDPVMFAFDGNGAMYVCEWRTYMQDEHATGTYEPTSRVLKLVDTDGDGKMDKRTVFIDGILLPRAVLPLQDRVLVDLSQSDSIWSYFDDDGDGVADRREESYRGRANNGNLEHQTSGLVWNLDNHVYSNFYRFEYRDGKLILADPPPGRMSQWGLARDDDGRLYGSSAGGRKSVQFFQVPAGYPILHIGESEPGFVKVWSVCEIEDQTSGGYRREARRVPEIATATCGQTVLRSPLMPEYYGRVVTCEPVGRLLRMSRIDWVDGKGTAYNAFPKSEFIRSPEAYFRPVWLESGPDGCLYICDMYRGIIQDKVAFPTKGGNKKLVARYHRVKKLGMEKVVHYGRIYRLVPDAEQPGPQPRMRDEDSARLVEHLAHADGWWRDTAQKLIVSRGDASAVPALQKMARDHESENARIHALWCLHGLGALDRRLLLKRLGDESGRVRMSAVHLAESWLGRSARESDRDVEDTLTGMLGDGDPHVVTQLYLSLNPKTTPRHDAHRQELRRRHPDHPLLRAYQRVEQAALRSRLDAQAKRGSAVYQSLCISCHGPEGKGLEADGKLLAPSLRASRWFRGNGNADVLARVLINGQIGPIGGKTYGEGIMVPLGATFDDRQMVDVLYYIGRSWHGWKKPIPLDRIGAVRKAVADRKTPWTEQELAALAGGK